MSFSVAIATATRAEWGLLRPFGEALRARGVDVRVVVTGMHLSKTFGETWREIESDGFEIDERIPILTDSDDAVGESQAMALALMGFSSYFSRRHADALLLLGDRYETLAIAEAAFLARIPIVHVHGGEVTEGAIDDAVRHCISKLSALHLTSTEEYRRRVIQLGEDPERVFCVGAVGVENALNMPLLSRAELLADLGLAGIGGFAMLTYHPVTLGDGDPASELDLVLDEVLSVEGLDVIATKANADAGGRTINARLAERAAGDSRLHVYSSLGSLRYLTALREASVVVGNSSSGILEAPAFGTPVVNVGERQRGRIRPAEVIDVPLERGAIAGAIRKAMSPEFRAEVAGSPNPYGDGNTSAHSADVILKALEHGLTCKKQFHDVEFCAGAPDGR